MLGNWAPVHLSWLDRIWSTGAERGRALSRLPAPNSPPLERTCQLAEALVSERGEASGAALAQALLTAYAALDADDRKAFFGFVADHFGPDEPRLTAAAQAYLAAPSGQTAMELSRAAEPERQELLRRINMAPGATAALIAIRRELLAALPGEPALKPFEADLHHVLASWFNRGFLELRRIDWNTPAVILEKLIAYEAVHQIEGWDDLRRRLAPDRRCFGFFHPTLPGEPLIFVEVALVNGMAPAIAPLLERSEGRPEPRPVGEPDTAIFYSISNCQEGLRGISFGNFLIKQVVEELKSELPSLKHFATLSPIPGFAQWLMQRLSEGDDALSFVGASEAQALLALADLPGETDLASALRAVLNKDGWWQEALALATLQPLLMRLCAHYLTDPRDGKGPRDPVARFHLGNGARLQRLNWLGNVSPRGIAESFGIMVNYLYDPAFIEINHESFVHHGAVARSSEVEALLQPAAVPSSPPAPRITGIVPFPRFPKKKRPRAAAAQQV